MSRNFLTRFSFVALITLLLAGNAFAQVSLTAIGTPTPTQTFDSLATAGTANPWSDNTTLPGWYAQFSLVPANPTTYRADNTNTGAIYSYGIAGVNVLTERAFGSVSSGTPGEVLRAVRLVNNTGSAITSLLVNFNGEQWRQGGCAPTPCTPVAQTLDFQYQVANAGVITDANTPGTGWLDHNALDFTTPQPGTSTAAALDGNAPANRQALSSTITMSVAVGQEIWLRWRDINDVNNDHSFGTDDFTVTPQFTPPTPTLLISSPTLAEGNGGPTTFTFAVTLSAPAGAGGVTFDIATADGTAQDDNPIAEDNDYVANSATGVNIPAGSTGPFNFDVTVNGDVAIEGNETFVVNVTNITGTSNPTAQGTGTINNDDATLPFININDVTQAEGTGGPATFTFNVVLSAPAPPGGVTFDIATADGTAQDDNPVAEDNDYIPNSAVGVNIPAGSTGPYVFNVTVNGDAQFEPNETFFVNITNVTGATTTTPGDTQGQGTINNDDIGLNVSDVTAAETNAGTTTFTFNVTLTAPAPPGGVTFDIATADGTAQDDNPVSEDNDYVANSVVGANIPAGSTGPYPFAVTVNGDAVFEPNETFFVNVTNVTGASIADGQGLGTINNDDAAPSLAITDASVIEGNAGTQIMTFTVTLTPANPNGTVTVDYATADDSATVANADYVGISTTTLTFLPGETSKPVTVTINGDTNGEGNEQFFVNLSNVNANAVIGDGQGLGAIYMDDPRSIAAVDAPFTENFNVLAQTTAVTTPVGWTFNETGGGARDNEQYFAGTGSSNTGDTYSFGSVASPDRAFGGVQSGSLIPTIGAFYRNDTGTTITTLTIGYTGEEWRLGDTSRTDRLDFQYSLDATSLTTGAWTDFDPLDFTTPNTSAAGAQDGNNASFRTILNATITGLNIPNGATFWIRFNDFNASGAGDDGLAVDDLSVTANITNTLVINDVSITEGDAGTQVLAFTVTRSEPSAAPTTFNITTADGTATVANNDYVANSVVGATIPGGVGATTYTFNVTINGDTAQETTENFFVNITNVTNAILIDGQGVGTINADDFTLTPIHTVQGSGNTSPLAGSSVTVAGIVTGIKGGGSGGFFVQEPEANYDADPNTSEGIFIFTAGAIPAGVVVGNRVAVTGTVTEFPVASTPHTTTELTTVSVSLLATGQPLPAAITLTTADGAATSNLSQYERFEGMRVAATLTATVPTGGFVDETNATGSHSGTFYGVIQGNPLAFREPGIPVNDTVPSEAACAACIPRFDRNPQRIRVTGMQQPIVVGQTISGLVGPLDYGFFEYTLVHQTGEPVISGPSTFIPVPTPLVSELTVSSFNLQRFFDNVDDPLQADETITTADAYANRLNKASLAIRNALKSPDVIGVVEVENITALQGLANKINADSGGAVNYAAYLEEGNDIGGIDVGFLVNTLRVTGITVTQLGKTATFVDPSDNSVDTLNDRPPLMLNATIQRTDLTPYAFTVIVNHLRSLNGNDGNDATGQRVRAKRASQAEYLANLVQSRQTANPSERIILVGDFNAFQFNDGLVDVINTIKGTPPPANEVVRPSPDLVNPDLTNLVDLIPAADRYSYAFDGNLQVLDHALVNQAMLATYTRAAFAHLDAGFPEPFRSDPNRPERISDHDGIVAYFDLNPPGVLAFSSATYATGESTTTFNVTVNRTGGTAGTVSATYTIAAGTATAGADFTAGSGTVTFLAGETSKTFPVTINNDAIDEPDQTINLSLSAPQGTTLGAQSTATLTIQDDDAAPVFTISDLAPAEGNAGSTNATLTVTLTGASEFTSMVTWATANDTATAGSDYTTSGATLTFNGPGSQTINVPILGDTIDEPASERLFVNLSGATNATIGDAQGEITILDDDGEPQLLISDLSVNEGNSGSVTHNLVVTLVGSTSQTVTVDFTLTAGTATCCGVDFSGPNGTLTFPAGTTTRDIGINVFGDTANEPNETVLVNLSNPTNATIGDNQGVLTIVNDDAQPTLIIGDVAVTEGNAGTVTATFTVTLTGNTNQTVTVDYATANGNATAGSDYTATSGTLTFAPGTLTQTFNVTVTGDTANEANETFVVNLTNATNATITDNQATGTINNDDGAPTLIIGDVPVTEGNAGTVTATFTVTLTGNTAQTVTVDYATANGTATAGSDYTAASGTLTFAPGTLTQTFNVTVTGDTTFEANETFVVNLTNATNATITDNQATGTINNDDAVPVADLTITTQISPTNPRGGQNLTITITVRNNGPADATNVVVTDNIPAGMTLVSSSASQGTCSGNPSVGCSLGTILNGATATVTIVLRPPAAGGTFNNQITVTSNETDPTPVVSNSPIVVVAAAENDIGIPTLSEWALIAMALMLAAFAALRLRT